MSQIFPSDWNSSQRGADYFRSSLFVVAAEHTSLCGKEGMVSGEIVFRRMVYGPKEDLFGLLPFKGQTGGEDIANAVIECMDKHHIPLDKTVSISTDGAKTKALNHRQLKEFLFEMESDYADLLLHNKVRWLS
ncbi:general transcription factor II-I repeat domain-containing protein 2 [Trichonephila clavipes]|nr:general transcription factor II-I repeat domain-containing protein 2 [Trichonephila clavipes]